MLVSRNFWFRTHSLPGMLLDCCHWFPGTFQPDEWKDGGSTHSQGDIIHPLPCQSWPKLQLLLTIHSPYQIEKVSAFLSSLMCTCQYNSYPKDEDQKNYRICSHIEYVPLPFCETAAFLLLCYNLGFSKAHWSFMWPAEFAWVPPIHSLPCPPSRPTQLDSCLRLLFVSVQQLKFTHQRVWLQQTLQILNCVLPLVQYTSRFVEWESIHLFIYVPICASKFRHI